MQYNYTQKNLARFWGKVQKTNDPNDCWLWTGAKLPKGYGLIGAGGAGNGNLLVHRVSWMIAFGNIPDGLMVLHKCDNPSCVNPSHLFLGTNQDNVNDMIRKGRMKHRALSGEENGHHKLTDAQIAEIRKKYRFRGKGEESGKALAKKFGIVYAYLLRILHYKNRA